MQGLHSVRGAFPGKTCPMPGLCPAALAPWSHAAHSRQINRGCRNASATAITPPTAVAAAVAAARGVPEFARALGRAPPCRQLQRRRRSSQRCRSRPSDPAGSGDAPAVVLLDGGELGGGNMQAAAGEPAVGDGPGTPASTQLPPGDAGSAAGKTSPAVVAADRGAVGQREIVEMLRFALPALGLVLCDPLMSLIDTACVGRISSLQLAALGPNTAIFNFAFQTFAFLGVATTNIVALNSLRAPGLSSADLHSRRQTAERTLCNSLQLAAVFGCLVAAVLLGWGRSFLAGMGTAPELLEPAWQYLSIRALAAPAVLIMAVSQGACLGQQDSWTPFNVLIAAGLLNAVGDIYLIYGRGMGVAGAAIATAAAQALGAAYFLWHLWNKGRQPGGMRLRWTGLPQPQQMKEFLAVAATLFARTIFGMAAYFSMTTAATRLGTLATATHQVAMQTFWFLSYFPEPLSLAAQSLLARDRGSPHRAAPWAWLLLRSGAVLGLLLAAAVGLIFTRASWLFTADVAVQLAVAQLAPVAMATIAVCSVMMMFDGISVGSGSFTHLPASNVVGLGTTLALLHVGQRAGWGLGAVWGALIAFYATRLLGHVVRYLGPFQPNVFRPGSGASDGPAFHSVSSKGSDGVAAG